MDIAIVNGLTGRMTFYKPSELRRDALHAVKGKGRLVSYHVHVQDGAPVGASVALVATYQDKAGWQGQVNVAI